MLLRQQAQQLEGEFKSQQATLQEANAELERKARQLAEQNAEVEGKNREIEDARISLQEKAEQLALTSKYKSEFLANMSHELRSPLNSLLLLAEQLRQNRDQNLTEKQVEMVRVMHAAGNDLLHLINDILDLSKIEAGSATLEIGDVDLNKLVSDLDKGFRYQTEAKGLAFTIDFASTLPPILRTDGQRLKQVLTNLLSNAVKFTSKGSVSLSARVAREGWNPANPGLAHAPLVIAFSVRDSGIGIAADKMRLIFEAFQQADAGTSRRYGGTGLGLAISREIARLLDGELDVESEEGVGSTFTFYLPQQLAGVRARPQPDPIASAAPAVHATPRAAPNGHPLLLIIEDDPVFARTLQDMAHDRGDGAPPARAVADRERPGQARRHHGRAGRSGSRIRRSIERRRGAGGPAQPGVSRGGGGTGSSGPGWPDLAPADPQRLRACRDPGCAVFRACTRSRDTREGQAPGRDGGGRGRTASRRPGGRIGLFLAAGEESHAGIPAAARVRDGDDDAGR
jgi:signal transduction histidine kinase